MAIYHEEIEDGVSSNKEKQYLLFTIGNNLKYLMQKNNINSIELANEIGLSSWTISKIIHGKMKPNPLTLFYLADYFRVSINSFYKNNLIENHGQKESFGG